MILSICFVIGYSYNYIGHCYSIILCQYKQSTNYRCDQICRKGSYACTVSRHTFHPHLTSRDQQHVCVILPKVEQFAFTQASFSSLSDIHVISWPLNGPIFSWQVDSRLWLPHDWVMSLVLDLAAYVAYIGENDTNWSHFSVLVKT